MRRRDNRASTTGRWGARNARAVKALLEEYGEKVETAAKVQLAEEATRFVARAKQLCPVGKPPEDKNPGRLRESIHAEASKDGLVYNVIADAKTVSKGYPEGYHYGRVVEYGHNGQPFLYPTMDELRDSIRDNLANAIREAVRDGR